MCQGHWFGLFLFSFFVGCAGVNEPVDDVEDNDMSEELDTGDVLEEEDADGTPDSVFVPVSIYLSVPEYEVSTDQRLRCEVIVVDADGVELDVSGTAELTSSNPDVMEFYISNIAQPLVLGSTVITAEYEGLSTDTEVFVTELALPQLGDLVINEIYADVAPEMVPGATGFPLYVNPEYVFRDFEFIEIVNSSDITLDLSGVAVFEKDMPTKPRHTFSDGAFIMAGESVVVFGGGEVSELIAHNVLFFTADNNDAASGLVHGLAFSNDGDTITIRGGDHRGYAPDGTLIAQMSYCSVLSEDVCDSISGSGHPGADDGSMVLSPEVWGDSYIHHGDMMQTGGDYSPGTFSNGAMFPGHAQVYLVDAAAWNH